MLQKSNKLFFLENCPFDFWRVFLPNVVIFIGINLSLDFVNSILARTIVGK